VVAAIPTQPAPSLVAPDLRLANAEISPIPPYEGDIVHVSVTVANVGEIGALAASIDLLDARPNGEIVPIGRTDLSAPLGPGQSTVAAMPPFFAVRVGEHTLAIRLNNVTPAETNTNNDELSLWMQVLPARSAPPPPPPSDGLKAEGLAALGIGALLGFILVVVAIGIVVGVVARPRLAELEPPPAEPPDQSPPPIWPP
jgi:hypothetical protein